MHNRLNRFDLRHAALTTHNTQSLTRARTCPAAAGVGQFARRRQSASDSDRVYCNREMKLLEHAAPPIVNQNNKKTLNTRTPSGRTEQKVHSLRVGVGAPQLELEFSLCAAAQVSAAAGQISAAPSPRARVLRWGVHAGPSTTCSPKSYAHAQAEARHTADGCQRSARPQSWAVPCPQRTSGPKMRARLVSACSACSWRS